MNIISLFARTFLCFTLMPIINSVAMEEDKTIMQHYQRVDLPKDLLWKIFSSLDLHDQEAFACLSKRIYGLLQSPLFYSQFMHAKNTIEIAHTGTRFFSDLRARELSKVFKKIDKILKFSQENSTDQFHTEIRKFVMTHKANFLSLIAEADRLKISPSFIVDDGVFADIRTAIESENYQPNLIDHIKTLSRDTRVFTVATIICGAIFMANISYMNCQENELRREFDITNSFQAIFAPREYHVRMREIDHGTVSFRTMLATYIIYLFYIAAGGIL